MSVGLQQMGGAHCEKEIVSNIFIVFKCKKWAKKEISSLGLGEDADYQAEFTYEFNKLENVLPVLGPQQVRSLGQW